MNRLLAVVPLLLLSIAQARGITIVDVHASSALVEFGTRAHVTLFFDPDRVSMFETNVIREETDKVTALRLMLANTGLEGHWTDPDTAYVVPVLKAAPRRRSPNYAVSSHPIDEQCSCPIIGGEPVGPWCRDRKATLIYAPELCPRR